MDQLIWGLGLEHETHIFHLPTQYKEGKEKIDGMVLYDSYEVLTDVLINREKDMSEDDYKYAKKMWSIYETSGRYCGGRWVLKGTDTKMPEFVTGNPMSYPSKRRYMKNYVNELVMEELSFYRFLSTYYKKFGKQMARWGTLSNHPFGMSNYIKVPKSSKPVEYSIERTKTGKDSTVSDYTGSYHITITLPHNKNIGLKQFVGIHQNFANQFQWIEPLLVAPYFTGDDKAMGTRMKRVKGSYRVLSIGWGNFAGSDVRKIDQGIGRYSNIESEWRKGVDFVGKERLKACERTPRREPGSISALSSDVRTFGNTDPLRPWHRVSGAPMSKGNGVELRIFDNFDVIHLYSLCKLIAYLAENSRKTQTNNYVYQNEGWIKATRRAITEGWTARMPQDYLDGLRNALGLTNKFKSNRLDIVMETVANELFHKNRNGLWVELMLGPSDKTPIELPHVNRDGWEFGFAIKANRMKTVLESYNKMLKFLCERRNTSISKDDYKRKIGTIFGNLWKRDWLRIAYLMKRDGAIDLDDFGETIKINAEACDLRKDFNDIIYELASQGHIEGVRHILNNVVKKGKTVSNNAERPKTDNNRSNKKPNRTNKRQNQINKRSNQNQTNKRSNRNRTNKINSNSGN